MQTSDRRGRLLRQEGTGNVKCEMCMLPRRHSAGQREVRAHASTCSWGPVKFLLHLVLPSAFMSIEFQPGGRLHRSSPAAAEAGGGAGAKSCAHPTPALGNEEVSFVAANCD